MVKQSEKKSDVSVKRTYPYYKINVGTFQSTELVSLSMKAVVGIENVGK